MCELLTYTVAVVVDVDVVLSAISNKFNEYTIYIYVCIHKATFMNMNSLDVIQSIKYYIILHSR